jgi:UDP-GlcNAc:undecaprenyl-phosphate GlcNAc-1-phosphate transferase
MNFFTGPLIAFAATILLILVFRPIAAGLGLVDVPNARSSHVQPTPLIGGLAIFIAVTLAYLIPASLGIVPLNREILSFFGASLLLIVVGVIDDRVELSSMFRFCAQIVAALVMIYGGRIELTDIGAMTFSGEVLYLGFLSVPFTVFATLGVINALNMCDGLDGLSGSLALISLSGLMIAAFVGNSAIDAFMLTMLATGILGFLLFNFRLPGRKRASVFLGDSGSMFLGFALTWFAISLSQGPARIITPAAALWFLMLPIFDTVVMMLRRLIRRQSPFAADREHLHHVFLMAGFSVNETVAIMASAALIGVGLGLLTMDVRAPEFSVAGIFLIVGMLYFWMVLRSWKILMFIQRSINRRKQPSDRRSGVDRRSVDDPDYYEAERRFGSDRRQSARRQADRTPAGSANETTVPVSQAQIDVRD